MTCKTNSRGLQVALRALTAAFLGAYHCVCFASQSYCAIEVGSKGVKGAAYTFEDVGEYLDVRSYFNRTIETSIVNSATANRRFTQEAMMETASATADLMLQAVRALPGCHRLVVMSSGVYDRGFESLGELATYIREKTGVNDVEAINPSAEADFALRSSVPQKSLIPESVLYDIGSGNTKIGYVNSSDGRFKSISLNWGSVSFTRDAFDELGDFRHGLAKLFAGTVGPEFERKVGAAPAITNRKRIYWVGGAAWATALWSHPDKASAPIVELSALDLDNFIIALQNKSWTERDLPLGMTESDQLKWKSEFARLQEIFTAQNLQSGVGLMRLMLQRGNPKARIYFPRNGQWLYGYTLSKFRQN